MYYVYILKSVKFSDKIYIGYTSDLKRRFYQHNNGESTYTRKFIPWKLVFYEAYHSKIDATNREKQLKRFAKAWDKLKGRIRNSLDES